MEGTRYCGECGNPIAPDAKFCPSCGAEQARFETAIHEPAPASRTSRPEPPAPEPEPPLAPEPEPPPARQRLQLDAAAGELAGQVAAGLRVPAVATAGLAGLIGAAICLAAGLLVAVLFPDDSLIGLIGGEAGVVTEAFRQVLQFELADLFTTGPFEPGAEHIGPAIFVLLPIGGCAVGIATQAHRIEALPVYGRLAAGAAVGVPFGFAMLVCAVLAGDGGPVDPSLGGAFGLGLLWGALGGLLGLALAGHGAGIVPLRTEAEAPPRAALQARVAAEATADALRPLGLALLAAAVIGTGIWLVQTVRDVPDTQGNRSEALALVENSLYAVEHGVHLLQLGALAEFEPDREVGGAGLPLPVEDPGALDGDDRFTIFAYGDAMEPYTFVPILVVAIAIPVLMALLAGFSVARGRGVQTPPAGAAWGALVGPVWAVAMAIANALLAEGLFGSASGDSAFASFLIGGLVLGAAGGALAAGGRGSPASAPRPMREREAETPPPAM